MSVPVEAATGLAGLTRQERLEQLRRRIAAVPARGESAAARLPGTDLGAAQPVPAKEILRVPEALAGLLPAGGLVRGSVVSFAGSGSLLLGLIASASAAGAHVAVIGRPRTGLLAASEMGAQLSRIAVVPDPGPDPVEVAAVLLDGIDLVVLGLGGQAVAPTRARAVVARARSKGSTLVVTDGQWGGAELHLDARVVGYDGLGAGVGRLQSVRIAVRAQGRTFAPRTARLDLRPVAGAMEWTRTEPQAAESVRPVVMAVPG